MFSQFRQAVESLAPIPIQPSDKLPEDARRQGTNSRSNSLDSPRRPSSPLSSSQLAESALSNLRKSLATQRSGSVGSIPKSPAPTPSREPRTKSTLEDRLRAATFAIGEAGSASTSVETSRKPSLSPRSPASTSFQTLSPENVITANFVDSASPVVGTPPESKPVSQIAEAGSSGYSPQVAEEEGDYSSGLSPVHADTTPSPVDVEQPNSENVEALEPSLSLSANSDTLQNDKSSTPKSQAISYSDLSAGPQENPSSVMEGTLTVPITFTPSKVGEKTNANEIASSVFENASAVQSNEAQTTTLEDLQEKLKRIEQRFTDVSTSFKRLQAEKQAADLVLHELTPLESVQDSGALRDYLSNLILSNQAFRDDIKHLSDKLQTQEARIEELRDTHRLESSSQSAQIEKLRTQISEAEALLQAAHSSDAQAEETATKLKTEIERLHKELERTQLLAKEEEEKRVKAISLLKTVRQKLVKAEKDKEDTIKEKTLLQEKDKEQKERGEVEKAKLRDDLDAVNVEREKAIIGLRAQFDRELATLKDRYEKELIATKGQYELESVSKENAQTQEISARDTQIRALEQSLAHVMKDKNTFFDDLQLRQAELESAQSHLESLQSQNTEYQYQLRELDDRYVLLKEDFAEAQREQETRSREPVNSADEVARALSVTEAKYDAKISELRRNLITIEKERNDSEAEWSQKLRDKSRELEDLRRLVGSASKAEQQHEDAIAELRVQADKLGDERRLLEEQLKAAQQRNVDIRETEVAWKSQEEDLNSRIVALEHLIEESNQREAQLRLGNKTLRDELRKVQSSAALLERQRNPGVGYWTSRTNDNNSTASQTSVNSTSSGVVSRTGSPEPASKEKAANEEDINLEYLRNVILQFLEHKEMRPNLVRVLSIILRFTPQETRRLIAKV